MRMDHGGAVMNKRLPIAPDQQQRRGYAQARTGPVACLLLACALVLGGCAHDGATISSQHYALGELTPPAAGGSPAAGDNVGNNGRVLGISAITVAPWLAGTGFFYKLAYRDDSRLAAYAYSDWVAPPATLLQPLVRDALATTSGWQAVVGPAAPAAVDARLYLRLENFSQVFTQPGQSVGVIKLTATLIDSDNSQVLAQHTFAIRQPAPTPDAQGGAQALRQASRQLVMQLRSWVQQMATR